jgi:hypothetical protein
VVKHKANMASVNRIKEIKEKKNEEKTGNIKIKEYLYGCDEKCNEISSVKIKYTYIRCKKTKNMDKVKKYVLRKSCGSVERWEGARKKNKEKEEKRYKVPENANKYKTCVVRYKRITVRKAVVKCGKNEKPNKKIMQTCTYMRGACTHRHSTDSTWQGRVIRREGACRKNKEKRDKMYKDQRNGTKYKACDVRYEKIARGTVTENCGKDKNQKRKKMKTKKYRKGACTHGIVQTVQ